MPEQQNLIPNLNEMMEEYVGISGEEATLELQTVTVQEEGVEERTEVEYPSEENRKRKRNVE